MTFVFQLRGSKKMLTRPATRFWRQTTHALCALRLRLAFVGLLGVALERPLAVDAAPEGGVLPLLCGVLTASVSATLGLLLDASRELTALFSRDSTPLSWLSQSAGRWLGEPPSPFALYRDSSDFPALSWYSAALIGLAGAALSSLGGGFRRAEPYERQGRR